MAYDLEPFKGQIPAELKAYLVALVNAYPEVKRLVEDAPTYDDKSGTPGNATSNTVSGRAAIAAGAAAATITCNKCVATSVVLVMLEDLDATAVELKVVPGAGSFVVTANANATAATKFRWYIAGEAR